MRPEAWKTIDMEKMFKLRKADPSSIRSDTGYLRGSGSHLDPPGYPSFFWANPYEYSNQLVIPYEGEFYVAVPGHIKSHKEHMAERDRVARDLWLRPDIESERVKTWIQDVYCYFNRIWKDENGGTNGSHDAVIRAHLDQVINLSEEELPAALLPIYNEWYWPAMYVRRWYPEHQCNMDLVNKSPGNPPNWYTLCGSQPSPEECNEIREDAYHDSKSSGWRHPIAKTYCQFCGWRAE